MSINNSDEQSQIVSFPYHVKDVEDAINNELVINKELREVGGEIRGSQQLPAGDNDPFTFLDKQIIPPPINFDVWKELPTINTRLSRAISVFARNIVGLGWELVANFDLNEDTPEPRRLQFEEEKKRISKILNSPNPKMPLSTTLCLMKTDQETIGNGYLEIIQNNKGDVQQILHVPGPTVRILKNGRGFVQVKNRKQRFFRDFSNPNAWENFIQAGAVNNVMDARTGRFVGEEDPDNEGIRTQPPPLKHRASALLHFKLYSTLDPNYGLPRFIAAVIAVLGNRQSSRRNLAFFENDAVPRMAILVSGGRLSTQSVTNIREFFQGGKGVEQAHRIMVIQPDTGSMVGIEGDDTVRSKIELKPLTVGSQDDMSFEKYRVANDEEVREAFGLAQSFFQAEGVSRASAIVAKKITDEQEFEPERNQIEFIINHTLLPAFDAELTEFKFSRPQIVDPMEQATATQLLTNSAVVTPNEMRKRAGLQPFPEAFAFANKPWPVAREEFRMGVALLLAMTAQTVDPVPGTDVSDAIVSDNEQTAVSQEVVNNKKGVGQLPHLNVNLARLVMSVLNIDEAALGDSNVALSNDVMDHVMSRVLLTPLENEQHNK